MAKWRNTSSWGKTDQKDKEGELLITWESSSAWSSVYILTKEPTERLSIRIEKIVWMALQWVTGIGYLTRRSADRAICREMGAPSCLQAWFARTRGSSPVPITNTARQKQTGSSWSASITICNERYSAQSHPCKQGGAFGGWSNTAVEVWEFNVMRNIKKKEHKTWLQKSWPQSLCSTDNALKRKRIQKHWLIFKNHLF